MGKQVSTDPNKVAEVEAPFVQLSAEFLRSDAWRTAGINCRRLIEFLMNEHMAHGGLENGNLMATYDQLSAWGISRKYVSSAITEAEQRHLVIVERGGRKGFASTHANRFRLTFLKYPSWDKNGVRYFQVGHEWKTYQDPGKIRNLGDKWELSQATNGNCHSGQMGTVEKGGMAETLDSLQCPNGNPYIYLGCDEDPAPKPPPSKASPKTRVRPPEAVTPDHQDGAEEGNSHPGNTDAEPVPPAMPDHAGGICGSHAGSNAEQCGEHQLDLEDMLDTRASGQDPATTNLRRDAKAWKDRVGKGALGRLAGVVSVSSPTMSNFIAGRFNLNRPARAALRDFLDQNHGEQT